MIVGTPWEKLGTGLPVSGGILVTQLLVILSDSR
jgi:hypothetical protein